MHLHYDDEQRLLRDSIERFAREQAQAAPEAIAAGLTELGLLALAAPEAAGGLGGKGDDLLAMMEAVGRGLLAVPLPFAIAALDILGRHGTEAQRDRVAGVIEGDSRLGLAPLETGRFAEGQLTGQAALVPGAAGADTLVVVFDKRAFLVEVGAPGQEITPLRLVDGTLAARLRLRETPAEPIPATPDQIADSLARATNAASAQMLGILERLLADTLDHVKTRQQFGVAIGSFQTIQHRMARLYVMTGQGRSLVTAAALGESGPRREWLRRVAAAKAQISEQALHLAQECVQFHGGMGITAEVAVSRGHRQLMVLARLFGDAAESRRAFDRLAG